MPIYEYRCSSCGHELEALQKWSEAPLALCPACSKGALVKLVSAAGFQLKGTGWYATDFKGSGSKPAAKNGGDASKNGESESKSDANSDAKSDAKVESKAQSSAKSSESKSESKTEATKAPASSTPSGAGPAGS
jgi:putative FmdB family regulatory protein